MRKFVVLGVWGSALLGLTQSEKGDLLDILFEYSENGGDIEVENKAVAMAFNVIKTQIDINVENYQKRVEMGKLGGAPRGNSNAKIKDENNLKQPKTTINNLNQPKTTTDNQNQPKTTENNQNQHKTKTKSISKTKTISKTISKTTTTTKPKTKTTPLANEPRPQLSHMGDEGRGTKEPAALTYTQTGVPAALGRTEEKKKNAFCDERNTVCEDESSCAEYDCGESDNKAFDEADDGGVENTEKGGENMYREDFDEDDIAESDSGDYYDEESNPTDGEDDFTNYSDEYFAETEDKTDNSYSEDVENKLLTPPVFTGKPIEINMDMFDRIYATKCRRDMKVFIYIAVHRCLRNGYDVTLEHINRFCTMLERSGWNEDEQSQTITELASKPLEELVGFFT